MTRTRSSRQQRGRASRLSARSDEIRAIHLLRQRVVQEAPDPSSTALCPHLKFTELPLSYRMQRGLADGSYVTMTSVQRATIHHCLADRDMICTARTGSGKTLCFLIPVLERLYRQQFCNLSGCGAIIIAPTRELALQIFSVLQTIGRHYDLSAGLCIGGSDFPMEQSMMEQLNIVIGTPGRILHHMTHTPLFNTDTCQMVVLDEADRCLDLGFQSTIDSIMSTLPSDSSRQTLLFSATLSPSVQDLARLSLRSEPSPIRINAHEKAIPTRLRHSYLICSAEQKFDILCAFIERHKKMKMIAFVSSRKQVRFLYSCMSGLRLFPSLQIMQLHGGMSQSSRSRVYQTYLQCQSGLMIATDIAARGLDFPSVDYVIQIDCPDSKQTYLHRIGRTARHQSKGNAIMMLLPSEMMMAERCAPIQKVKIPSALIHSMTSRLSSLLVEKPDLKYLAQSALVSYCRAVYKQSDKQVFDIEQIDLSALALSWGLPSAPKLSFTSKRSQGKNRSLDAENLLNRQSSTPVQRHDNISRLLRRVNTDVYGDARARLRLSPDDDDDDDDGLVPVHGHGVVVDDDDEEEEIRSSQGDRHMTPSPIDMTSYGDSLRQSLQYEDETCDRHKESQRVQQLHQRLKRKAKGRDVAQPVEEEEEEEMEEEEDYEQLAKRILRDRS